MTETTLCYIEKDGKYLMIYRNKKKNDANSGKYIGIGGHLENGETPHQCAVREVKEETGLTLKSLEYRGIVNFISDIYESEIMYLFTSTDFEGELIECNEGDLHWIEKSRLDTVPMWQGDMHFLKKIAENSPFFEMTLKYESDTLIGCEISCKPRLLVSACLLGEACRYDAKSNPDMAVLALSEKYELIPACAEVLGGLPTPRIPSEIISNRVINQAGADVTQNYINGEGKVLDIAIKNGCKTAILKSKSPSCGKGQIYDGTFTRTLKGGNGICAELLMKNGITVLNEKETDKL